MPTDRSWPPAKLYSNKSLKLVRDQVLPLENFVELLSGQSNPVKSEAFKGSISTTASRLHVHPLR